ncbi:two-component sensor histidine kinase [Arenicella chitinivorans]|uniref:histidine kinase n=1 Tax=Arenicella chitinivorans TaxID=1329800 RepID=A0A918VJ69_9GAMM|nr:HAMP domain-containing sensor histidine kinase [Arenicella chitinivorans]GHA00352.1 two-component sensor histidine kinase [Arenicella chitinivorans]
MSIAISNRIRNAIIALTLVLSLGFGALIFLLVYVIEDQVFINQLRLEKQRIDHSEGIPTWGTINREIQLFTKTDDLPATLPDAFRARVERDTGIHEFFDANHALFVAHYIEPTSGDPYYLAYDVSALLAVRSSRTTVLGMIVLLTLLVAVLGVVAAHWITRSAFLPLRYLTQHLSDKELDDAAITLAREFSDDEVGHLAKRLALAMENERLAYQREYEFNKNVSHELRTPIQVVTSSIELLRMSDRPLPAQLDRLSRASEHMQQIVEVFLWLASDRQLSAHDQVNANHVVTIATQIAQSRQLDLQIKNHLSNTAPYPIPQTVLNVVLRSLIQNAVSHAADQRLTLCLEPDTLSLSNRMTLAGEAAPGFGIGLTIVERLCARFGWTLTSKPEHAHGRYVVTLSFASDAHHRNPVPER